MTVTRDTIRQVHRLRRQVGGDADKAVTALNKRWQSEWQDLRKRWKPAADEVANQAATLQRWPQPWELARNPDLRRGLDATDVALTDLQQRTEKSLTETATKVVGVVLAAEAVILATQWANLPGAAAVFAARLPARAAELVAATVTARIPSVTGVLAPDTFRDLQHLVTRGLPVAAPSAMARDLSTLAGTVFDAGRRRAATMVRTEVMDAHRAASHAFRVANLESLTGWVWVSALQGNTCVACWSMHGTVFPGAAEVGPLGHVNCLTAGAIVSGPRPLASTTRWFVGEVVDIETSGGNLLSVTPNHPILTTHGWVAAGDLCEGSEVICGSGFQGIPPNVDPDDYQVPALVEEVANSLGGSVAADAVTVPTATEDFHGDGAGSEVHVVRADRLLWQRLDSTFTEHARQRPFGWRDAALAGFSGLGAATELFPGGLPAPYGFMCGSRIGGTLTGGSPLGFDSVCFRHRSEWNSSARQPKIDRYPIDTVLSTEGVGGLSSQVLLHQIINRDVGVGHRRRAAVVRAERVALLARSLQPSLAQGSLQIDDSYAVPSSRRLNALAGDVVTDRVLKVRRRAFEGHVFNLQTRDGWYLANGIVTHNCRCVPLTLRFGDDLGALPDARQRFDALPEADQAAIMGPSRLALLRAGRIDWASLATRRTSSGWRTSYAPRAVADLQRIARTRRGT